MGKSSVGRWVSGKWSVGRCVGSRWVGGLDKILVNLLNKIRKGEIDQNVEHITKSRFIDINDPHYLGDVLHIFAENAPVTRHNNNQLKQIPGELVKIQAKDQLPKNCDISDAKQAQKRKQSETGGLAC